jgi:hypothetical protein
MRVAYLPVALALSVAPLSAAAQAGLAPRLEALRAAVTEIT